MIFVEGRTRSSAIYLRRDEEMSCHFFFFPSRTSEECTILELYRIYTHKTGLEQSFFHKAKRWCVAHARCIIYALITNDIWSNPGSWTWSWLTGIAVGSRHVEAGSIFRAKPREDELIPLALFATISYWTNYGIKVSKSNHQPHIHTHPQTHARIYYYYFYFCFCSSCGFRA